MHARSARLAALGALITWSSCQDGTLLYITIADESETTVEAGTILEELVSDLGFESFIAMDITASQELENQGVEPGDIQDVRLSVLVLSVPDGQDLSFLDALDVTVEAPGLQPARMAWQDTFPEGETTVYLELEDLDLTDYAVSQSMTLSMDVTGNRPEQDTVVTAGFELDVGVTAQGACNFVAGDTEG